MTALRRLRGVSEVTRRTVTRHALKTLCLRRSSGVTGRYARPVQRTVSRSQWSPGRFEVVGFAVAFVVVHAVLWWLTSVSANLPLGDVTITYRRWIETGQGSHFWVGIDEDWVYPILAIVPMAAAALGGVASIGTAGSCS